MHGTYTIYAAQGDEAAGVESVVPSLSSTEKGIIEIYVNPTLPGQRQRVWVDVKLGGDLWTQIIEVDEASVAGAGELFTFSHRLFPYMRVRTNLGQALDRCVVRIHE